VVRRVATGPPPAVATCRNVGFWTRTRHCGMSDHRRCDAIGAEMTMVRFVRVPAGVTCSRQCRLLSAADVQHVCSDRPFRAQSRPPPTAWDPSRRAVCPHSRRGGRRSALKARQLRLRAAGKGLIGGRSAHWGEAGQKTGPLRQRNGLVWPIRSSLTRARHRTLTRPPVHNRAEDRKWRRSAAVSAVTAGGGWMLRRYAIPIGMLQNPPSIVIGARPARRASGSTMDGTLAR
jgi:hypothetical protein